MLVGFLPDFGQALQQPVSAFEEFCPALSDFEAKVNKLHNVRGKAERCHRFHVDFSSSAKVLS
jgi:hypothetical protein